MSDQDGQMEGVKNKVSVGEKMSDKSESEGFGVIQTCGAVQNS